MQQSQNNKFDQQVKNTLENASVEPPAFLWNTIESRLPSNKAWYSKYKYLLLLLLLVFTSASSILIYKNLVLKNPASQIALNKRLYKDETSLVHPSGGIKNNGWRNSINNKGNTQTGKENNTLDAPAAKNTPRENTSKVSSVASFYDADKNGSENEATKFAEKQASANVKRATRLKRLEVKEVKDPQTSLESKSNTGTVVKNTILADASISSRKAFKKLIKEKSLQGNEIANDNSVTGNIKVSGKNTIKSKQTDTKTDNSDDAIAVSGNSSSTVAGNLPSSSVASEDDVTKPITDPIRSTEASTLTASAVPVKVQQSPIPSRDVLRSMIEPEKLEKLDIESQAAGINDLNPNKEKMLKNLKQFAGYDINKGFHIGAFISINNVWLNKKEFSTDENTSSIRPKVQFGKAYGLNIGYDYSNRWGIELEWQISEQGQKYSMCELPDYKKCVKDVNLLYTKFPLMLKYKQLFINNYNSKPISLSFLFGPQFAFLLKKDVQMDGKKMSNIANYNKVEFGMLGGFDFDLFMTRNLALTIGGRTGFGTSFKKGQPMSFQLGVTTQLNFRFPKKIK